MREIKFRAWNKQKEIMVYDNEPKGAIFDFTVPAEEVEIHE